MLRPERGGRRLSSVPVVHRTGFEKDWHGCIDPLRRGYYVVEERSIAGDAPKDFVRVYQFGECRRESSKTWPAFIAKVGHKWYPGESITEHLMTRVGQCLGVRVADSRLMYASHQLRFLSRYFLQRDERLMHGSEILGAYLQDREFVTEVDAKKLAGDVFTFQVVCDAIRAVFPQNSEAILTDFVRMLAFDALVGNHDRHINNWGVIVHLKGRRAPAFSPIYDTARGLFWNDPEHALGKRGRGDGLRRYVLAAKPQVGWDGAGPLNHFDLIERIVTAHPELGHTLCNLGTPPAMRGVSAVLDEEFGDLMSRQRRDLIWDCLNLRLSMYSDTVKDLCGMR